MPLIIANALVIGRESSAQTRIFDVQATEIGSIELDLLASTTYTITTSGLGANGDTELWLVRLPDRVEAARNDDATPGSRSSKIVYNVPANRAGRHRIFVTAKTGTPAGTCTLTVSRPGTTVFTGAKPYGGTFVNVPASSPFTPDRYETSLLPGGSLDTLLIGLDNAGSLMGFDDDGNVAMASRLADRAGIRKVIVGSERGNPGMTRLLANDVRSLDSDHDLLGTRLEEQLRTCDSATSPGCAGAISFLDSDLDGISDYREVFGFDALTPQLLSRWGANPAHKDVFVEIDFESPHWASQPLTEAMAMTIRDAFAVAPANAVGNLDGAAGISVHLDVGYDPVNPANRTLLGNWGGSTPWVPPAPANNMASFRRDVFVHGHVVEAGGSGGSGWFSATLDPGAATPRAAVDTVLHELGHALMLQHEGAARYVAGLNCNPLYPSVMSYSAAVWGQPDFSDGSRFFGFGLNPSNLCEQKGLGGGDTSHLAAYGLGTLNGVDWNHDGTYDDCDHPVRAAVNWWPQKGCDAQSDGSVRLVDGRSPSTAMVDDYFYIFTVTLDGQLVYHRGQMSAAFSTAGCPLGFTRAPGAICTEWVGPETVHFGNAPVGNISSANVLSVDGRIHVAFLHDGNPDEVWTTILSNPSANGRLQSMTQPEAIAGSKASQAPELFVLDVDPYLYGQLTRVLAAFWPDTADGTIQQAYRWPSFSDSFIGWTPLLDINDQPIQSRGFSPAAVHWDASSGTYAKSWLAVADKNNELSVFFYRRYADRWENLNAQVFPNGDPPDTSPGKPGFAYRPLLDGDGQPLSPAKGELYLTHRQRGSSRAALHISSVFDDAGASAFTFPKNRSGNYGYDYFGLPEGEHIDFYTDPAFPYLKAAFIEPPSPDHPNPMTTVHPFPDGIIDLDFTNISDFEIMKRGICVGVHRGDISSCGPPGPFGF